MIEQLNETAKKPSRVVVIGAKGFVGSSIVKQLTEKNNLLQKENNSIKEELIQIQNQIDVILELLNNL